MHVLFKKKKRERENHSLIFLLSWPSVYLQVFSMFLETLVDFILVHKEDLQDWLFVLLTQLLKKMGADLLGSVQAKVQKALDVTRSVAQPTLGSSHFSPFFFLNEY